MNKVLSATDDILMLTSSSEEATAIYEKFQNIETFSLRYLSLLDFKMQISPTGKIYTSFHRKIHH